MNIATNIAGTAPTYDADGAVARPKFGAVIFSLEMTHEQLAVRMICSEARVASSKARHRSYTGEETDRLVGAAATMGQLPVWFVDTPGIGITEIRSRVRREQRSFNRRGPDGRFTQRIGCVIVDYIQLMTAPGEKREEQVAHISRGLKMLANELKLPVVGLSQLNRDLEKRAEKARRPQLSDLRESGSLEQDADVALFIHRPEMYLERGSAEHTKLRGYAEVVVAKQRNGPTGQVPITYCDTYTKFETRSRDAPRPGRDD